MTLRMYKSITSFMLFGFPAIRHNCHHVGWRMQIKEMQAMLSLIITDGEFQEEAHANIIHKMI